MAAHSIASIMDRGTDLIRAIAQAEGEYRTPLMREMAAVTLELRGQYLTRDGVPDWEGRTTAYREANIRMYADAQIDDREASRIRRGLTWHIGNRMTPEQRAKAGLLPKSPKARSTDQYRENVTELRAVRASDPDVTRALAAAHVVLRRVPDSRMQRLDATSRRQARAELRKISKQVQRLTDAM